MRPLLYLGTFDCVYYNLFLFFYINLFSYVLELYSSFSPILFPSPYDIIKKSNKDFLVDSYGIAGFWWGSIFVFNSIFDLRYCGL